MLFAFSLPLAPPQGEDDGESVLPLPDWLAAREGAAPTGVYAVFDSDRRLQLVSYSRNCVLALRAHLAQAGPTRAAWVRVMVFANKAMCSRANLEAEAAAWLRASGPALPPGNGPEAALWGAPAPEAAEAAMTAAERATFEDKKLKMKKAMGLKDKTTQAAEEAARLAAGDETQSAAERRALTMMALDSGDWSAVIDGQTRDATGAIAAPTGPAGRTGPAAAPYVVSPFSRTSVHRAVGDSASAAPAAAMTVESVDAALNGVRPYLIADGGNVEVASVVGGVVALRLQGACGTCSSSAATMKMGIERALKNAFGDALKEVIQLGGAPPGGVVTTAEAITEHLEGLAPAIKAYGGVVLVKKVAAGVAVIAFRGPVPLGQGISAAVRDKFPDIREVLLEEPAKAD